MAVFGFRYANACVGDAKQGVFFRALRLYRNRPAVGGELDGIADQVVEDFLQPHRIGKNA